ncbi:hypothetical protein [Plantibacter sp. YIM 135249]|uniref:hypothetical protein n=1 Tax=Plantibacter sp. YIM 135249 TaxID=3423918 RepID=UPI003D3392EF
MSACLLGAISLTGCGTGTPAPSSSATVTPTTTPTATTAPTPSPTATDAAFDATCDTILTGAAYAKLAEDHLVAKPFTTWNVDLGFMQDGGGLVCKWGNQGDIMAISAQMPMTEAAWAEKQAALVTEGFTITNDPVDGFTKQPDLGNDDSYVNGGFAWRDGNLYFTSSSNFITDFPAFAS